MFRKDEELTPSQRGLAVRYVSLHLPWFVPLHWLMQSNCLPSAQLQATKLFCARLAIPPGLCQVLGLCTVRVSCETQEVH